MASDHPDSFSLEARLAAALHPRTPDASGLVGSGVDPTAWLDLLPGHRVAGLIAGALDAAGLSSGLDPAQKLRLQRLVMDDQRQRAALDAALELAGRALSRAGLDFILLKGAALGLTVYEKPHLRPMSDVDILVREAEVEGCLAALSAVGYHLPDERDISFWREAYYNLPMVAPGETQVAVELHWSIAQERQRPDLDGLFARSRRLPESDGSYRVFSLPDLLLHQALHHAYHFFQPRLSWILDLALIHLERPPLAETSARAAAWGMKVPLALSCLQVEKVFPGVVSDEWMRWASAVSRARWLFRIAGSDHSIELLRGWKARRRQLVYALLMLDRPGQALRGLAAWAGRALRFGDREGHERLAKKEQ